MNNNFAIKGTLLIGMLASIFIGSAVASDNNPPFYGTKFYNFMGGSGTGESVTIKMNNSTVINAYGAMSEGNPGLEGIIYKGNYSNPIILKDGTGYLFKNNKIYLLTNGKITFDCKDLGKPCESNLYE